MNYTCKKCKGTSVGSHLCENPECPNMPCCGLPVSECTCDSSTKEPTDEEKNMYQDVVDNLHAVMMQKYAGLKRTLLIRKIIIIVGIIAMSGLALLYATKQEPFYTLVYVIFTMIWLYQAKIAFGKVIPKPPTKPTIKYRVVDRKPSEDNQ